MPWRSFGRAIGMFRSSQGKINKSWPSALASASGSHASYCDLLLRAIHRRGIVEAMGGLPVLWRRGNWAGHRMRRVPLRSGALRVAATREDRAVAAAALVAGDEDRARGARRDPGPRGLQHVDVDDEPQEPLAEGAMWGVGRGGGC